MKTLLRFLLFLSVIESARAYSTSSPSVSTQSITIPGNRYTLNFSVQWFCDDYPQNSAPGRIELVDSGGTLVGRVVASVYQPGSISLSVTGAGSVSNTNAWVDIYAPNGTPADGQLTGTWNIAGVAPGNYTLRFYNYTTWESTLLATTVWTYTFSNGGSAPQPPTIAWTSTPGAVGNGQSYTVAAHGHDGDGNLTAVSIWKNGQPFAFAGGGNGTDGDSSNPTSDTGPQTVTFTAQAFDADGQSSPVISQTVTVAAANQPPTITWTSTPSSVASDQSYTISTHGHDSDGNLTAVSIWKSGQPFAFAGGGNGTDGDSSNPTSDTGPQTVTFTAQATDAIGATSATISQTVTVGAPASVTASITGNPTSATAPAATTISWTSANATSVSVSGSGLNSSAGSGSQTINGLAAGTYTYTITAQGYGGPVTQTATFTVNAPASVSASISASPANCLSPGSSTISWTSANATSVSVSGSGLNSSAGSGTQTVTGLSAGTYNYTITAQGANGPATQTTTVVVNASASVSGAISASPSSGTAPASTTISWSTSNATAVAASGSGINSTAVTGVQTVSGLSAGTYTYTLTAQGSGGPLTRTAFFTVSAPVPNVSGSISASPTSATAPGSTTIVWNTSNATSASVNGSGITSTATSGSQTVNGLAAGTYTYTLTAQGNGGPVTRTATFTVNPGASITASMSISPTTMNTGANATLTWTTANATSVKVTGYSITGSPYETSPSLMVNIGGLPPGTYTYSLVAQGNGGPITKTATVVVNATDGLDANLIINPVVIYSNQTATMNWNITGANFKWVHGLTPNYNGVSIYPAPASGSTTLSGLAPGTYSYRIEYGPGAFSASRTTDAYLTVLGVNRTVAAAAAPAGTGSVIGAGTYQEGTSATLTATPDATHVFSNWSGDLSSPSNPLTFTVGPQNYTVVANFAPAIVSLKYRGGGARTLLASPKTPSGAPFVIQVP